MKQNMALSFPYLCAMLIVGFIVIRGARDATPESASPSVSAKRVHVDPVCKMEVGSTLHQRVGDVDYFFCTSMCADMFVANPDQYLTVTCLVCRADDVFTPIVKNEAFRANWQGKSYSFCTASHRDEFRADPAGYFMHTMWGIPNWLYYASIAIVLLLSFGLIEWRTESSEAKSPPTDARTLPILNQPTALRSRYDLMQIRWIRALLGNGKVRFAVQAVMVFFFMTVLAAGLFGNQLPGKNIAPLITWTVWWCGLVLLIMYAGKAWCYVCPWEAMSRWSEGLRLWGTKKEGFGLGMKWPKFMRNVWPATILFVALTWVELGLNITGSPRATAYMGLAMLGMTFVSAFLFERQSFCRYGCLVGRISGLYALFSPIEIRPRDREVCRTCGTKSCFKGNADGDACPTSQYLASMDQNTYCISCMECVKTCEKDNVAVNLRPWGEDLVSHHRPRSDEAYLALMMLSLSGFHGLTMTAAWGEAREWIEVTLDVSTTMSFTLGMLGITIAPILLYAVLVLFSHWLARTSETKVGFRAYFIRYAYALLPIALFYHLAHNSEHLLMEGQKVLPMLSDPFGWEWNLFGTAKWTLAPLVDLSTLWIIQVLLVMVGHVYSLWVSRHAATALFGDRRSAFRSQIPMLIAMIIFSLMSLWLLKQPMEMRSSAM